VEYKLALPRLNGDLAAGHSSLSLSLSISQSSCVTSASSCCVISPRSHQFSKHSDASMNYSLRRFLSGVINFFVLLNTRSHSADMAGTANMSKAQRYSIGKADWASFHYLIGLKAFRSLIGVGSRSYLVTSKIGRKGGWWPFTPEQRGRSSHRIMDNHVIRLDYDWSGLDQMIG
jgi:hypothetical protein